MAAANSTGSAGVGSLETVEGTKNVTFQFDSLFYSPPPCFQVQATTEIVTLRGRRIGAGDVLVIDPDMAPSNDRMVLVDGSIQPFIGQHHQGVVSGFMSAERI